jgi:hypothetical protein
MLCACISIYSLYTRHHQPHRFIVLLDAAGAVTDDVNIGSTARERVRGLVETAGGDLATCGDTLSFTANMAWWVSLVSISLVEQWTVTLGIE